MARKLIIDADPGIGDAIAILAALFDPEIDVLAITPTAGQVDGATAGRNVQTVVDLLDPPKFPRVGDMSEPASELETIDLGDRHIFRALNGPTGLGDIEPMVSELQHRREATKLILDIVRAAPYEITILTLGPLTNIAIACERAPDFLELIQGLVILGGSIDAGGDVTAAAEFNMHANPTAARNVLLSQATKTLVPLDASAKTVLTFEQFDEILSEASLSSRAASLLQRLLPYGFRQYHECLGIEGFPLHAVTALVAAARPQLVRTRGMSVDVETEGELTRGMTIFERRRASRSRPNLEVVSDVDPEGILDYFRAVVRRALAE